MQTYVITATDLQRYFTGFSQRLAHAPGAAHLVTLAKTAKAIPESILADLTAMPVNARSPRRRLDAGMTRPQAEALARREISEWRQSRA
jgi:hypothetical protein